MTAHSVFEMSAPLWCGRDDACMAALVTMDTSELELADNVNGLLDDLLQTAQTLRRSIATLGIPDWTSVSKSHHVSDLCEGASIVENVKIEHELT